jgi:hypothetical protein
MNPIQLPTLQNVVKGGVLGGTAETKSTQFTPAGSKRKEPPSSMESKSHDLRPELARASWSLRPRSAPAKSVSVALVCCVLSAGG